QAIGDLACPVERAGQFGGPAIEVEVAEDADEPRARLRRGTLGHVIDEAARLAAAIKGARRALQHLHALDIEELRDVETAEGVAADTVVKHHVLAETAKGHPGIAEEADARDAAVKIGDLARR